MVSRFVENTQSEEASLILRHDTASESSDLMEQLLEQATHAFKLTGTFDILSECSTRTGNYVRFLPELGFLPVLIDNDNNPVFMYQFVETLDELVDYDALAEEYPGLSFAQIDGAVSFLREIVKLNILDIDIDELEDAVLMNDRDFLNALRRGLADEEVSRVLDFDE